MSFQKIMVPIDFSPLSRQALNQGIAFARKFGSRLTLLHVVELPGNRNISELANIEKEHHEQTRRMLEAMISPANRTGLDMHVAVKTGDVVDEILTAVHEESSDLVIMGTHGKGRLARWLIGSVTQNVLQRTDIPVLTICHVAATSTLERILFANSSPGAVAEGPRYALELAHDAGASLITFHAVQVGVEGGAEADVYLSEQRIAEARSKMEKLVDEAARLHVDLDIVLADGTAAENIVQTARQKAADLIMLVIHERDRAGHNVISEVSEKVIREAHLPVLTLPAATAATMIETREPKVA